MHPNSSSAKSIMVARSSFALAVVSQFFALFGVSPDAPAVAALVAGIGGTAIAWWLSERQVWENDRLIAQVDQLEGRTETERGISAAITGQGELATWSYEQLVQRLLRDGHIS